MFTQRLIALVLAAALGFVVACDNRGPHDTTPTPDKGIGEPQKPPAEQVEPPKTPPEPTEEQAIYECPEKCDGKTFDKPGKCPVCQMDLKQRGEEPEEEPKKEEGELPPK